MRWLRGRRSERSDPHDEWMATAAGYANQLTESGSRCHLNDGRTRFCQWQAQELEQALRRHEGAVEAAAAELGISRSQLYRRAQKLGIQVALFRR